MQFGANSSNHRVIISGVAFLLCLISPITQSQDHLYRYVDKDDVKVLGKYIPPEYVQYGYEILDSSGNVIKVVKPAPSDEEVAKAQEIKKARTQYAALKKRYSSTDDIESAKHRRLDNINTSISILRGNIVGLDLQIENLMGRAAEIERSGKDVPANVLSQLEDLRAEHTVAQGLLDLRLEEHEKIAKKFDHDLLLFVKGATLENNEEFENNENN